MATITLTSAVGTNKQIAVATKPITSIVYTVAGATTFTIEWAGTSSKANAPTGISVSAIVSNKITISGTPTTVGVYAYIITTDGSPVASASGSIIVNAASNIVINDVWIRDRFNLQYNNIFSNQAPGLVDSEISTYLTMAHIEIIDEYTAAVDVFEKNRSILTGYIYQDEITGSIVTTKERGIDYQTFEFTENYWKIIKEFAITNSNSTGIPIKPISYDGFNTMVANPFKKPNGLKGWRLDINSDKDEARDVKILFKKSDSNDYIKTYIVTYIVTPKSFDLTTNTIPNTLTDNPFLAEKIINRAVELATRDYRENTLQTQVQINKRSE